MKGVEVVYHNATGIDKRVEDLSEWPFILKVSLRPPEFMTFAFIGLYGGSEEIIALGKTQDDLESFIEEHRLRNPSTAFESDS